MKVKIIKKNDAGLTWYNNHIDEIIDVIVSDKTHLFPYNKIYEVVGPEKLLLYYKNNYGYNHLGIDVEHIDKKFRKEKIENILK